LSEPILKQILEEITSMKDEMTTLKSDITSMKEEMSTLKSDITSMKEEMSALKSDVVTMKDDLATVKDDITSLRNELGVIKLQVDENTQMIKALLHGQEELKAQMDGLSMNLFKLEGEVVSLKEQNTERRLTQLETDMKLVKRVLTI
jgi:chromosome segregation ATPase